MSGRLLTMSAIAFSCACGSDDIDVNLVVPPEASELRCGSNRVAGLAATLFISGNLPPCDLSVDDAGRASGTCRGIPTGITRFLVLRLGVPRNGRAVPLRYAITEADLTPQRLMDSAGAVSVVFSDDGSRGLYVDTDDEVATLREVLAGPKRPLSGAICFARSLIASEAGTAAVESDCRDPTEIAEILDLDADSCTNLRELCDGTSPEDDRSASCLN